MYETDSNGTCKEGWLQKRGEHIKTWRPRYFILKSDGNFIGFNTKPIRSDDDTNSVPNNTFFIKDCKIIKTDRPKINGFTIRCLGSSRTNTVERVFAASTQRERDEWILCIQEVAEALDGQFMVDTAGKFTIKRTLHDFEFLKVLGKGTFGKVILCRERDTKKICAMKILKKTLIIAKNEIQHTKTENKVMRTVKHPFITSLVYSFQTHELLCLVMEYVNGGELFFHLSKERRFSEDKSKFYCAEICLAVGYLHENQILYRDIKLENILLDNEGHIKLADFGLCKMDMPFNKTTATFCGTPEYLAPEILTDANISGYGRAVDWWAVGVLLYEMLTGRLPFSSGDIKALFEKIVNDAVELPKYLSCNARSILSGLLEKIPNKRIGSTQNDLGEIKAHQFFSTIDWTRLLSKDMQPPFRPQVTSDIDTRYFDKEFTGENVQITPPNGTIFDSHAISNPIKHFDSFSFYGSKSSLGSNQQMSCPISSANGSSTSLNKNEILKSKSSDCIQEIDFIYQDSYSYSMDYVDGDCPNGYLTSILYDTQIPTVDIQMQLLRNFNFYEANMLNTTQQSSQANAFLMQHSHDINSTVTEMEI